MLAGPAQACTNYAGASPCGANGLMDFTAPRNPAPPRASGWDPWASPPTVYVVPLPPAGRAPNWELRPAPYVPPSVPGAVWVPGLSPNPGRFYGP